MQFAKTQLNVVWVQWFHFEHGTSKITQSTFVFDKVSLFSGRVTIKSTAFGLIQTGQVSSDQTGQINSEQTGQINSEQTGQVSSEQNWSDQF